MKGNLRTNNAAGIVIPVLLVLVIIAAGFYFYKKWQVDKDRIESAQAVGEQSLEESTTPVPVEEPTPEPTPEPAPEPAPEEIPVATPTPRPALTLAEIVKDRTLWPKEVALTRTMQFPAIHDGKVIGSISRPAGTILPVRSIGLEAIEVIANKQVSRVPVVLTDLLVRVEKLRPANDLPADTTISAPPTYTNPIAPPSTVSTAPATSVAAKPADAFLSPNKLLIEVIRARKTRIEGGDFDDKIDRISLRLKISNPDARLASAPMQGTIYVFADSILRRGYRVLLDKTPFSLNLAARQSTETATPEVSTAYDTTNARFGYKYGGWVVVLKDAKGTTVFSKASAPSLLGAPGKLEAMPINGLFDSNFEVQDMVSPARTSF